MKNKSILFIVWTQAAYSIFQPYLYILNAVFLCITSNSINHQSFIYSQINDQTVLFLTIQLSISHFFSHTWNVKKFYLTHRLDFIKCYHSKSEWTWEQWQWRAIKHSPKLQYYLSLTIRLFSVISWTLVGRGRSHPSAEMQPVYSTSHNISLIHPLFWNLCTYWFQSIISTFNYK